jgi:hypothetical protein
MMPTPPPPHLHGPCEVVWMVTTRIAGPSWPSCGKRVAPRVNVKMYAAFFSTTATHRNI